MKKILQARVNVLIEQNRQLQQKRQKQRLLNLKQKNSYSLYQEPSKHTTTFHTQSRVNNREQSVSLSSYKHYGAQEAEQIYRMRFNELQSKRYQNVAIEELRTEQRYYIKIIQNLTKKIDKLAVRTINDKLAKLNTNSPNLSTHNSSMIVQKQNAQRTNNCLQSKKEKFGLSTSKKGLNMIAHEQGLNSKRIVQLNREYAHLMQQINKFLLQDKNEFNLQMARDNFGKECCQVARAIKHRKRQISQLRGEITTHKKQLERGQNNLQAIPDNVEQIKGAIYKTNKKNKDNQEKLATIQQKTQELVQRIRQLQYKKNEMMLMFPEQTKQSIATTAGSTIKTPKNQSKASTSFKIKHLTTLDIQSQHQYLIKKKEVVSKSIQTENKRWKSIYTQKMKKLVNEYSNYKQMENMSSKLQQHNNARQKQFDYLKYQNSLTETYD